MTNSGAENESRARYYRFGDLSLDLSDETLCREGDKLGLEIRAGMMDFLFANVLCYRVDI